MSPRRDRPRPSALAVTRLEDRSVPSATVAFTTPLSTTFPSASGATTGTAPLGWQAYTASIGDGVSPTYAITATGDIDTYTLALDAGTRLTVVADQLAGLRAKVSVFDPFGGLVTPAVTGTGPSANVVVGGTTGTLISTAGTYTFQVEGVGTSTGAYRLRAFVGTVLDAEIYGAQASGLNDNTGSAQNLNAILNTALVNYINPNGYNSATSVTGGTIQGVTVYGNVGRPANFPLLNDNDDYYQINLNANDTIQVGLQKLSATGTATVSLFGITPTATVPTNYSQGFTYTATAAGTYYVRVNTGAVTTNGEDYLLSVVRNGSLDQESNDTVALANLQAPITLVGTAPNVVGFARGAIGATTDVDFYRFTIPANSSFTISTTTPADGPGQYANTLNPAISLMDSGGNLIGATAFATADGRNKYIRFQNNTAAAVPYTVKVSSSLNTVGEYQLLVDAGTLGVANSAPLAVSAGGPYTITEGTNASLTLTATGTDPEGVALSYQWDVNGDGVTDFNTGSTPSLTLTPTQLANFVGTDGPGGTVVTVLVSDGPNMVKSLGTALAVTNVAPTAVFQPVGAAAVVNEGSGAHTVTFTSLVDPSPADLASLRYSYDLNNDGTWEIGTGVYATSTVAGAQLASATVPATAFYDNGLPVVVRGRVMDKDGGFNDYFVTFTITNVAPTATPTNNGPFLENTPGGTVGLTNPVDPSPTDISSTFRYSYDFNSDGTWDVGNGTSYAGSDPAASQVVPVSFYPDGGNTLTVTIRIFDKDGGFTTPTPQNVTILNVAPTATVTNSGPVNEGSTATVSATNPFDPSANDLAGLRYSFSFTNSTTVWNLGDGTYAGSVTATTATVPASFLDDGFAGAIRPVRVRVLDKDGGFTDYTTVISIVNAPPTAATLNAVPSSAVIGQTINVSITGVTDPSTADTGGIFRYGFDLNNDGVFSPSEISTNNSASYTTTTPNTVTIRAEVIDKDGGIKVLTPVMVMVSDTPPVFTSITAPVSVNEGGTALVSVTATHPSVTGPGTALRYSYDFDNDGTWDVGDGLTYGGSVAATSATVPASFLDDGDSARTVRVRVFETYGLSVDATATIAVRNVAPSATFTGPATRVEAQTPITFTFSGVTDPSQADAAAGFRYSLDLNNNGNFNDPGDVVNSTSPVVTTTLPTTGRFTARGVVTDKDGAASSYTVVVNGFTPVKPSYAAGVEAGNAPVAKLFDAQGNETYSGMVFDAAATGGVRVATADFNGDRIPDLIVGTGPGSNARVKVIDGKTGATLLDVRPFGAFTGGVFVAAGDIDGDGFADIAVSPDEGGGPRVVVYSGKTKAVALNFYGIDDPGFRGGARVGLADVNGDGFADLLVAAGTGGGPRVAGYDGQTLFRGRKKMFNDFYAFDPDLRNGVYLAGGDIDGDGKAEIVTGAGPGGGPQVIAFSGADLLQGRRVERANFFGGNPAGRAGIRVAVADVDGDSRVDILAGEADGPHLDVYLAKSLKANGTPNDAIESLPFSAPMNGIYVG